MITTTKLSKDASRKDVEQKLYRSMIRRLLYLIENRPDISFTVGVCARYQENPKESHLMFVKKSYISILKTSKQPFVQNQDNVVSVAKEKNLSIGKAFFNILCI